MRYADLHIHSTCSDGTLAISVTDHDAVEGTLRAEPLARAAGLLYVHGVEIDTLWEGRDVHVLAYGADFENAQEAATLSAAIAVYRCRPAR